MIAGSLIFSLLMSDMGCSVARYIRPCSSMQCSGAGFDRLDIHQFEYHFSGHLTSLLKQFAFMHTGYGVYMRYIMESGGPCIISRGCVYLWYMLVSSSISLWSIIINFCSSLNH